MKALVFTPKTSFNSKLFTSSSARASSNTCRMESNFALTSNEAPITNTAEIATNKVQSKSQTPSKKIQLNWITAIAFVKFDIDQGNVIESIYPEDAFSTQEKKIISLLSFPDSNAFSAEGALKFVFRLKRDNTATSDGFSSVFGYAYFRQERDPSNARGFSQKSLVILSVLPFTDFFENALDILGHSYFDQKMTSDVEQFLKENYNTIMNEWAKPQPGVQYEFNLYGHSLFVGVPQNICESKYINRQEILMIEKPSQPLTFEKQESPIKERLSTGGETDEEDSKGSLGNSTEDHQQSLSELLCSQGLKEKGCFQDINLYKIFKGNKINLLWKVWELVLTNQPLMIVSDLPSECSEAVLGVISTICPLEYQTDYQPYFTIFDPEYREVQALYEKKTAKNAIIGVTNPLFLKIMQNYPNILHLEKDYLKQNKNQSSNKTSLLQTTQKLYTLADPNLENRLIPGDTEETDAINNVLLRKSLQGLTESFLSVFKIYFKLQVNDIKKFDEKDFMRFLELQKFSFKGQFSSNTNIVKLYANFLKSSNFYRYIKNFPNVYIVKHM